jgi:hypothetical protein
MSHQWSLTQYQNFHHHYSSFDSDDERDEELDYGNIKVYELLHQEPDFTLEWIKQEPDKDWNYSIITNTYRDEFWDMIISNPDINWQFSRIGQWPMIYVNWDIEIPLRAYNYLSYQRLIPIDKIRSNMDKPWNFHNISSNLDIKLVLENADLPFEWERISWRKDFTFEDVLNHLDKPWNWYYITSSFFNWERFVEHIDLPWHIDYICSKGNFRWEYIDMFPNIKWNFDILSGKRRFGWGEDNFNWNLLDTFKNEKWNYKILCRRPDFNWCVYKKYIDKDWSYDDLCLVKSFDWNILLELPDKPWNYSILAKRKDLNLKLVFATLNRWNLRIVSKNPCITKEIVIKYYRLRWRGKWSQVRRDHAAKIIQSCWRRVVSDPYHPICQRRLLYEFGCMSTKKIR